MKYATYRPSLSYGRILAMASRNQSQTECGQELNLIHSSLNAAVELLSDPSGFINRLEDNAEFRMAYEKAMCSCNPRYSEVDAKTPEFKGIALN